MLNAARLAVSPSQLPSRYALILGAAVSHPPDLPPDASRLIAWDPVNRRAVWSVDRRSPVASGVLATAGSLVFQGSTEGTLEAMEADSGKPLWKFPVGTGITAAPITYEAGKMQMIAVVAGAGGARLLEGGPVAAREVPEHNTPRLLAFSLNGTAKLPREAPAAAIPRAPAPFGTPEQVRRGKSLYARYCARCHGESTVDAGPLTDLKRSASLADPTKWQRIVYAGLLGPTGMPGFIAELHPEDIEALRAYVVERARNVDSGAERGAPRPARAESRPDRRPSGKLHPVPRS
jgi:mono/diheme cytochrome c family protein